MSPNQKVKQQPQNQKKKFQQEVEQERQTENSTPATIRVGANKVDHLQSESIRKLEELRREVKKQQKEEEDRQSLNFGKEHFVAKDQVLVELNNNSLHLAPVEASQFKADVMDNADGARRGKLASGGNESNGVQQRPATGTFDSNASTLPMTNDANFKSQISYLESSQDHSSPITPSYSSIFNTSHYQYRNKQQQQQQQSSIIGKSQLKKQAATSDSAETEARQQPLQTSLNGFTNDASTTNEQLDSEDDNEINESLPLSMSKHKAGPISPANQKKVSPLGSAQLIRCPSPTTLNRDRHQHRLNQHHHHNHHHHKCPINETDSHQHSHTKISFNDHHHRTPSYTNYQQPEIASSKRQLAEWQQSNSSSPASSCCDCNNNNCHKIMSKHQQHNRSISMDSHEYNQKYKYSCSKTDRMHQILKSIILILLTLLLLMIFTGIIVASHYLPQVFDRLLSATRSFNVTIAG